MADPSTARPQRRPEPGGALAPARPGAVPPAAAAARALVAALVGAASVGDWPGPVTVVLCPGSRSAPLAYALRAFEAAGRLRLHVRVDERSAGFVALGAAKATGRPAAVVTTSGTAVANLHPAVLEAHHSRVPLLVVAADRPRRLRGTWANQTSELQASLFGAALRASWELDPSRGDDLPATADRAVATAAGRVTAGAVPGPVLLDVAFDDPLVPPDVDWRPQPAPPYAAGRGGAAAAGAEVAPAGARPASEAGPSGDLWHEALRPGPPTVVVAGDGAGPLARRLAEERGWPLLAEPSSGARGGPALVRAYRHVLGVAGLGDRVERAVVLGRPTLTRPVTALLARDDVAVVQLARHGEPVAPRPAVRVLLPPGDARPPPPRDGAALDAPGGPWLARWRRAGDAAGAAVDAVLDDLDAAGQVTGPGVARAVARATASRRTTAPLVVAASNPVRDLDLVADGLDAVTVLANRGLSGIDGTVSTAGGAALALDRPVRALVGDLALLHDAGGLLAGPTELRPPLQIVVVDDGGGGIFGLLEHGEPHLAAVHERLFATPHGIDLAALAGAYGLPSRTVPHVAELADALAGWAGDAQLLRLPVERGGERSLLSRIRDTAVGAATATT